VTLAEAGRTRNELVWALIGRGTALLYAGRLRHAESDFQRAWLLSEEPDLVHYRNKVINNYAVVLFERARPDAIAILNAALGDVYIHDRLFLLGNIAQFLSEFGDHSAAVEMANQIRLENRYLKAGWADAHADVVQGLAEVAAGNVARAKSYVEQARSKYGPVGSAPPQMIILAARIAAEDSVVVAEHLLTASIAALHERDRIGTLRLQLELGILLSANGTAKGQQVLQEVWGVAKDAGADFIAGRAQAVLEQHKG
jgi:hypothetical protein